MSYAISSVTPLTLQTTLARVRAALEMEGFTVLGELDVQAMLREQYRTEIEPEIVIEAYDEAHRACNIAVRIDDGETVAEALGPVHPALRERIVRVVAAAAA
jgi:hypothetical protein